MSIWPKRNHPAPEPERPVRMVRARDLVLGMVLLLECHDTTCRYPGATHRLPTESRSFRHAVTILDKEIVQLESSQDVSLIVLGDNGQPGCAQLPVWTPYPVYADTMPLHENQTTS